MSEFLTYPIRSDRMTITISINKHLLHRKTDFQTIDFYETDALGRVLFLDNHIQLAEIDEFVYHEALVHVPLLSIENPKRALVVGGGDGAVLRELVKHPSLQEIHLVDIDKGVIEASQEAWPKLSDGAFQHEKVTVYIEDAFAFIKRVDTPYDLIVMDVTDVYEEEDGALSEQLFTREFHADCLAALSEGGMIVSQADNHIFCPYSMEGILEELGAVFPKVGAYQAPIPSFGGYSGYVWASRGAEVCEAFPLARASALQLKYLNETTYRFGLLGGKPGGICS